MNTHPNANALLLLLYEELFEQELENVRKHLAECKTCQNHLAVFEDTLKIYQRIPGENPPDEILSAILTKRNKYVPSYRQVISWIESLSRTSRGNPRLSRSTGSRKAGRCGQASLWEWRWALAALAGVLAVTGVFYLANRSSSLHPTQPAVELVWRSDFGDSLESLSERLVLLRENATAFSSPSTSGALTSLGSFDNEVLKLKARISSFSLTLSTGTF